MRRMGAILQLEGVRGVCDKSIIAFPEYRIDHIDISAVGFLDSAAFS